MLRKFRSRTSMVAAVFAALPIAVHGSTYYWNATGTDTWSNVDRWSTDPASGGVTGVVPTNTDLAVFNQSLINGTETIQLSANQSVGGILIRNAGSTLVQSDSATARTLSIGGSGISILAGSGTTTFGNSTNILNLQLDAGQTWSNSASSLFTVVNGVSLSNAGVQTLTIAGAGNTTIGGVIANGAGTLSLGKSGAGTLILFGVNTYTGSTAITGGTVQINADANLGAAPTLATVGSLVLDNTSSGLARLATTATFTLNANRGIALGSVTAGSGGGLNIASGTVLTYGGIIANNGGANSLAVTGGGRLLSTGANTFTGVTSIAAGTAVQLGDGTTNGSLIATAGTVDNGTFEIRSSATAQSYTGAISGIGSVVISGTGTGSITLSGASSYTGTTTIGTLNNTANTTTIVTGASPLGGGGPVIFNSGTGSGNGSTLQLGTGTTVATVTGKTLTVATGTNRTTLQANTTSGTNTWAGNIILSGTGLAQFNNSGNGGAFSLGSNASQTVTSASTTTTAQMVFRGTSTTTTAISLNSTVNIGTQTLSRTDSASLQINSPFNAWGTTTVSTGKIVIGVNDALPPGAALTLGQSGTSSPVLDLNGKTQTVASLSDSLNVGTATITSGVAGGVFTLNNSANNTYGAGTGASVNGLFAGGANLSLIKLGAGTFTLNSKAVNTYTGSTTVNAGTFNVDFVNIATPTDLLNNATSLVLGGGIFSITAKPSTATSQTITGLTVNAGGSTLTVNNAVTGTPTAVLNLGAITRAAGGGTVAFNLPSGAQSSTNGITTTTTTLTNGLLGGWATVGSDFATVVAGNIVANTTYTDVARLGPSNTISSDPTANIRIIEAGSAGDLAPAAAGTTDVYTLLQSANGGTATYISGATDILRLGATGGVLVASAAGPLTLGDVADNGSLTAGGAANTAGNLVLTNNSTTSALTVQLKVVDNGTAAVSLTKSGSGNLVLSGTNTYTGGTVLGGGTLTVGNTAALGAVNNSLNITSGSLDLAGKSIGIGLLSGTGGTITNSNAAAATLTIGNNNATGGVYYGVIAAGTGGVAVSKVGTGTLTLAGANTYAGGTTIAAGGTLQVGIGGNGGSLGTGAVTDNGTLAFNRSDSFTVANLISGTGGISQVGRGVVTLTNANVYTGATTISSGTIAVSGGANRLPSGTTIAFTNTQTFAAWLDIGTTSQTVSTITFPLMTTGAYFNGNGGTLTVNGNADLNFGPTNSTVTITADMSGLSNFVYNSSTKTFRVGVQAATLTGGSTNQNATVTLAASNTITASLFAVSDTGNNQASGLATLHLGTTNVLKVADVNVGYSNRSGALLDFAGGLTNPTVSIFNTNGTSPVNSFNIGKVANVSNNVVYADSVDFSSGTVTAAITSMTIGDADTGTATGRTGTTNGSFIMGAGTVTVGTINIGRITNTGGNGTSTGTASTTVAYAGNGVVTLKDPAGTLNATTITLATNTITDTGTGTTRSVSGTFNLIDGLVKAASIQRGAQTGTANSVTLNFNWSGGTLQNADSQNLTITSVPINLLTNAAHILNIASGQTGTIASTSVLSGAGALAKAGGGTAILSAANTYTGGTTVSAGALVVNGNNAAATGSVSVATSAMLAGTGTVGGATSITGILSPGGTASSSSGTLAFASTLSFVSGGSYAFELSTAGTPSASPGGSTPTLPQTNHDYVQGTGAINLTNATINVTSLGTTGFDTNNNYSWLIASSTAGVSGLPTLGSVAGTDFASYTPNFSLSTDANNLYLNFTALPEPGSLTLGPWRLACSDCEDAVEVSDVSHGLVDRH